MSASAGPSSITLADGRRVAYQEYGAPDGFPILNCHGGLLCRLDVEPSDGEARELGVRIISPDRPGVGGSDRRPGALTVDWAGDARELLDALDIDRCACMGWSLGGQYALAVAAGLGDRISRTAVIAGCPPLTDHRLRRELSRIDRVLATLSTRAPLVARVAFGAMGKSAARRPARAVKASTRGLPEDERSAVLEQGDWMGRAMAEGLRDQHGAVDEYRAFVGPWGFELSAVDGLVQIWQGDHDLLVPPAWAGLLAAGLPKSELVTLSGAGHLIALTHRREIMAALAAPG